MPKPVITGLYYGGVDNFIAPDGRPMVTGIRKRPAATGFLGTNGFPDDASAEPAHHTQDKTVHLFSRTTGFLRQDYELLCRGLHLVRISRRPGR
jgi:MOSC domain-containing protein YiiM